MEEKRWTFGHFDYTANAEEIKSCAPKGWGKIIDKILDVLPEDVRIAQIKEKYGSLRLYSYGASEEIDDLIIEAERESSVTCELCGDPAVTDWDRGWVTTLCEKCKSDSNQ